MRKRLITAIIALSLALCCLVGVTMAWLMDSTQTVENTFTYGDVDITLKETGTTTDTEKNVDKKSFQMVPGNVIAKDPTVTVEANSEACWLFVEITESTNLDDFLTYAIASGWKLYDTGATEIDTNANDTYIIYREVSAADAKAGITYPVLAGDTNNANGIVNVKNSVTKAMMTALKNGTSSNPTLSFKAYAVQSANVTTVTQAWGIANGTTT